MAAQKKRAGRVRSFTDAETGALRQLARELKQKREWNGEELGAAMGGIAQQNASRFVADGSTSGIDRTTANALAKSAGFRDVEHALLDAGVMAEMSPLQASTSGNDWTRRDQAIRHARTMGYPEAAILAVLHRYSDGANRINRLRWWMDRIVLEALAQPAERDVESAAAAIADKSGTEG